MQNYYRNIPLPPQLPQKPPLPKTPPPKIKKKKFDFKCLKSDTCKSLNEVEYFLNNFSDFLRYAKIVKLLKGKK